MKQITLLKLFLIFTKIGAILLGGGYVILPIITSEFSEKRNFISKDEILDYFALSQSLPGIIAANISMFIGYKLKGKIGAVVAMIGIITVPFLSIIFLASILSIVSENTFLQSALWGVGIAVTALILLTIREMWQNTTKDLFFYVIFTLALIAIIYLNFSPIKIILTLTPIGIICKSVNTKKEIK